MLGRIFGLLLLLVCVAEAEVVLSLVSPRRHDAAGAQDLSLRKPLGAVALSRIPNLQAADALRSNVWGATAAPDSSSMLLRLRGGKKGTGSQGKRGTGHKAHPNYKYNLSLPRKSRKDTNKRKRYTIHKKPERSGRHKHLRKVQQRFKNGFRCSPPYKGPENKGPTPMTA